jgi:hypothetical protein
MGEQRPKDAASRPQVTGGIFSGVPPRRQGDIHVAGATPKRIEIPTTLASCRSLLPPFSKGGAVVQPKPLGLWGISQAPCLSRFRTPHPPLKGGMSGLHGRAAAEGRGQSPRRQGGYSDPNVTPSLSCNPRPACAPRPPLPPGAKKPPCRTARPAPPRPGSS